MFNLFRLLENEAMKMFSMRVRNEGKHKFVATKGCETEEVKKILKS